MIPQNNILSHRTYQTCFSAMDSRFDYVNCKEETHRGAESCRRCRGHTHTLTLPQAHTQDHTVTDWLAAIGATSAFSPIGQQMLLDNGWLSNTATVRGHTHGPIRIYPTFLRCCLNDTGYHVKGHLTHHIRTWDLFFFITVLNRRLCIFLSAYIPQLGVGR